MNTTLLPPPMRVCANQAHGSAIHYYDFLLGPVYTFKPFTGTFRGDGHRISNFNLTATAFDELGVGLFGLVDSNDAEISDLGMIDPNIEGDNTGKAFGALVGLIEHGAIKRCYVDGGIVYTGYDVGGLVGINLGKITGCHSTCDVSGHARLGGLVGSNWGTISKSFSTGSISASGIDAGGFVGANYRDGTIINCYSTGDVNGENWRGGFVSDNRGIVFNCFSTGNVPPAEGAHIAGFAAHNKTGTINSCFWDVETSGQTTSDGGIGNITAEMKQQTTFEGWGFVNVWGIGEGQTYPYLRTHLAGDLNRDGIVNFLDFCILAGQWMEGEPEDLGVEITDVRIIRGEMDGGAFRAIEEVEEVEVGDVFVIKVDVGNFGAEAEGMMNLYGWELSPEGAVEVIGDGFAVCAAYYSLSPGESATLIPFCGDRVFEAKSAGTVTMSIEVGAEVCAGTFEFEIVPPEEPGVEVTDVRIIRGEMDGGAFRAIEEVEQVAVGDVFVIKVDVENFGDEAEGMMNLYGWELSPEGVAEVIGDGFMACAAFFSLAPGESTTLIPFCGDRAFKGKQAGAVVMSIEIGAGVCTGTFEFEVGP